MPHTVIVAYKPKPGKDDALRTAVDKHWPLLRAEGLATERPPFVMRSADGTIVEVFEWVSTDAVAQAHTNAALKVLWAEFVAACDYVPIAQVPEAAQLFAGFEAIE